MTAESNGTGTGLKETFYWPEGGNAKSWSPANPAAVNYDWAEDSPRSGVIPKDQFSVRWVGEVQPRYTGTYSFYTQSDDGVMLFVNNTRVIDAWNDHSMTEHRGTIDLVAGQKYRIAMQYYENSNLATARLLWSSNLQIKEIVPTSQLYPTVLGPLPTQTRLVEKGGTDYDLPLTLHLGRHLHSPNDKATILAGIPFWRKDNGPLLTLPGDVNQSVIGTDMGWAGIIPAGAFVGPGGAGTCTGVALIPPDEGMTTYILHFSGAANIGAGFVTVGFAHPVSVALPLPSGYEAVLSGAEWQLDPEQNELRLHILQEVVYWLRANNVPITAYVPASAFFRCR